VQIQSSKLFACIIYFDDDYGKPKIGSPIPRTPSPGCGGRTPHPVQQRGDTSGCKTVFRAYVHEALDKDKHADRPAEAGGRSGEVLQVVCDVCGGPPPPTRSHLHRRAMSLCRRAPACAAGSRAVFRKSSGGTQGCRSTSYAEDVAGQSASSDKRCLRSPWTSPRAADLAGVSRRMLAEHRQQRGKPREAGVAFSRACAGA
jgi:hypothetical protein